MAAVALGSSIVGGVASYFGKQAQAERMRSETREGVRRLEAENKQRFGEATAAAGASGVEFGSGSLNTYLDAIAVEMRRQSEWARKNGLAQANDVSVAGGIGAVGDIGSALFSFGSANNWWKKE